MEKEVVYEVVKVTKEKDESELDKALNEYRKMCDIYNTIVEEKEAKAVILSNNELTKKTQELTFKLKEIAKQDFANQNRMY